MNLTKSINIVIHSLPWLVLIMQHGLNFIWGGGSSPCPATSLSFTQCRHELTTGYRVLEIYAVNNMSTSGRPPVGCVLANARRANVTARRWGQLCAVRALFAFSHATYARSLPESYSLNPYIRSFVYLVSLLEEVTNPSTFHRKQRWRILASNLTPSHEGSVGSRSRMSQSPVVQRCVAQVAERKIAPIRRRALQRDPFRTGTVRSRPSRQYAQGMT